MYSPHCVRSVLTTSVKILPYRPPARLIRAKYRKRHGELRRLATLRKLEIDTRHFLRDYEQSVISVRDPRGSKMDAHPPDTFPWCRVRPESRGRIFPALWSLLKIRTELLRLKLSQNTTQIKSVCGFFSRHQHDVV